MAICIHRPHQKTLTSKHKTVNFSPTTYHGPYPLELPLQSVFIDPILKHAIFGREHSASVSAGDYAANQMLLWLSMLPLEKELEKKHFLQGRALGWIVFTLYYHLINKILPILLRYLEENRYT